MARLDKYSYPWRWHDERGQLPPQTGVDWMARINEEVAAFNQLLDQAAALPEGPRAKSSVRSSVGRAPTAKRTTS